MIFETIITSVDLAGEVHIAPFGIRNEGDLVIIAPYKPSTTLNNILATKCAVLNLADDVRVFAAVLTNRKIANGKIGRLVPIHTASQANKTKGFRLADCLAHVELELVEVRDDATRPQLLMQKVAEFNHKPFTGFNRAQAAVIELAVLVSRLRILPKDKIMLEIEYLKIAMDKTAGEREMQAWSWLAEAIENFYVEQTGTNQA
jgi:hypothetical protein